MRRPQEGKHLFILLELLVCLAILVAIGSVVLVRAGFMLDHYRFELDAKRFVHELNVTKQLATTADCDVTFHLKRGRDKLVCIRKTNEPLIFPHLLDRALIFRFLPSLTLNQKEVSYATVTFTGNGWVREQGTFCLESKKKDFYWILFPHFPQMVLTQSQPPPSPLL